MEQLYDEGEAAAYLRIGPKQLAKLRRLGRISFIQITPRRFCYTAKLLNEYIASQLHDPPREAVDSLATGLALDVQPEEQRGRRVVAATTSSKVDGATGRQSKRLRVALPELPESDSTKPKPRSRRR